MYNTPSFTLARTLGGMLAWYWRSFSGRQDTPLIVLASVGTYLFALCELEVRTCSPVTLQGFILGEGFLSIINLMMESFGVPHL